MTARTRYNLWPLLRVNLLDSGRSVRRVAVSAILQFGLPVGAGTALGFWVAVGLDIQNGVSVALPAASLLVGAMFGAFIFLTNLRVKLAESATYAFRSDLLRYVGAAAASCLYLAVAAMGFAGMLALVGSLPVLRQPELAPVVVGILFATSAHIGLVLVAAIRRLFVIYLNMFAADFDPPVPTEVDQAREAAAAKRSPVALKPTRRARRLLK